MARELKKLPSAEERQQIRERAGQVLAEAQALQQQLNQVEDRLGWLLQKSPGREGLWASAERRRPLRHVIRLDS